MSAWFFFSAGALASFRAARRAAAPIARIAARTSASGSMIWTAADMKLPTREIVSSNAPKAKRPFPRFGVIEKPPDAVCVMAVLVTVIHAVTPQNRSESWSDEGWLREGLPSSPAGMANSATPLGVDWLG